MTKLQKYQRQVQEGSPPQESLDIQASNPRPLSDQRRGSNQPVGNPSSDGANFLASLLSVTPFFDLFEYIADRSCSAKTSPTRNIQLKAKHGWFYWLCTWGDTILRLIVTVMVVYIAFRAAIKVIS